MSTILIPDKVRIVNSCNSYPLFFKNSSDEILFRTDDKLRQPINLGSSSPTNASGTLQGVANASWLPGGATDNSGSEPTDDTEDQTLYFFESTTNSVYELTDNAGAASNVSAFGIQGFGTFKSSQITQFGVSRGHIPQTKKISIDADNTSQMEIDLSGISGSEEIEFRFTVEATNRDFRLAQPEYEFEQKQSFYVKVNSSDTKESILAKLYNKMFGGNHRQYDRILTPTAVAQADDGVKFDFLGNSYTTANNESVSLAEARMTAIDKLEVESSDFFYDIKKVEVFDLSTTGAISGPESTIVTTFNPVVDVEQDNGVGYGRQLEFVEKRQDFNNYPYFPDFLEVPMEKETYTTFYWSTKVNRRHPNAVDLSDEASFVVYVKEDGNENYINELISFFATIDPTASQLREDPEWAYVDGDGDTPTGTGTTVNNTKDIVIDGTAKDYIRLQTTATGAYTGADNVLHKVIDNT